MHREKKFKPKIIWRNIIAFIYIHSAALYAVYMVFAYNKYFLFAFNYMLGVAATGYGIAAGAHRMWSHKAFKGRWPARLFFAFFQTMAGQNSIYEWVRDHRVHHKFSDTDADPHNINNGFFFSHMGWLIMEKHPDVKTRGATVDMSDMKRDWIVMFQKKYYLPLYFLICLGLSTVIPVYCWGETWKTAWHMTILRYVIALHLTWCTNSFAHSEGKRPYDKNIRPSEVNFLGWMGIGEGWHNFHHTFPWDYKLSEMTHSELTYIWRIVDIFAAIGWTYDLKTVSQDMIRKRVLRTGDGSHKTYASDQNANIVEQDNVKSKAFWGWDDKDVSDYDKSATLIK